LQKKSQIYATKKAVNPLKIHSPLFTHEFPAGYHWLIFPVILLAYYTYFEVNTCR